MTITRTHSLRKWICTVLLFDDEKQTLDRSDASLLFDEYPIFTRIVLIREELLFILATHKTIKFFRIQMVLGKCILKCINHSLKIGCKSFCAFFIDPVIEAYEEHNDMTKDHFLVTANGQIFGISIEENVVVSNEKITLPEFKLFPCCNAHFKDGYLLLYNEINMTCFVLRKDAGYHAGQLFCSNKHFPKNHEFLDHRYHIFIDNSNTLFVKTQNFIKHVFIAESNVKG